MYDCTPFFDNDDVDDDSLDSLDDVTEDPVNTDRRCHLEFDVHRKEGHGSEGSQS